MQQDERGNYEGQGTNVDLLKKKMLKDLEEKLTKSENRSEGYEFKYHESVKILNSLCVIALTGSFETDFFGNRIGSKVCTIQLNVRKSRQSSLLPTKASPRVI